MVSKKPKQKYIVCIWCGGNMNRLYSQYCTQKCKNEAKGVFIKYFNKK